MESFPDSKSIAIAAIYGLPYNFSTYEFNQYLNEWDRIELKTKLVEL